MNSALKIYATKQSNPNILGVIILIYFLLSLLGIFNHEIWLDEGHHWLLARDSETLKELIHNTRYEGHPRLWNIILYTITRFTHNVFWMQIMHIILSTITISIFLRKAPFSLLFKVLSIFGYAFLFEYNIISRNYILGVLFLFLALSIYQNRKDKYILFCAYLVLASNTHSVFLVITPLLLLPDFLENVKQKQWAINKINIGFLIFTLGVILSIIQIIPPTDSSFFDSINNMTLIKKIGRSFVTFYKGIFLIPNFTSIHFWNTNILFSFSKIASILFGLLSFFTPLLIFNKNKYILLYVYFAIAVGLVFFFITQRVNARSEIIFYLIFITGLWVEKYHSKKPLWTSGFLQKQNTILTKQYMVYAVISCHFLSGITAYAYDVAYPFTPAKNIADYLENNDYNSSDIITPFCNPSISSYTENKLYTLCKEEMSGYCDWNLVCKTDILHSKSQLLTTMSKYLKGSNENKIFITLSESYNLNKEKKWNYLEAYNFKYRLLTRFNRGIVSKSDYSIYEVSYHDFGE